MVAPETLSTFMVRPGASALARRRCSLAAPARLHVAVVVVLVACLFGAASTAFSSQLAPPRSSRSLAPGQYWSERREPSIAMHVAAGGRDGNTGLIYVRPKAKGFEPGQRPSSAELSPVVPGFTKQNKLFVDFAKQGHPVSEVFVRFEGKTPWKPIGEIVQQDSLFKEAIEAQWPLLVERSYYLFRKVRFWLPTENPIQFGYSNEDAEIEVVHQPIEEARSPQDLRKTLNACGYLPAQKPRWWRHMHTNAKEIFESENNWAADPHKKHLLDRTHNRNWRHIKRYNPDKQKGGNIIRRMVKKGIVQFVKEKPRKSTRRP